jgi:hypothetical protein
MYNTKYICSYMDSDVFIETDNVTETDKDFVRNCIYRQDLLNIFNLDKFDETVIIKQLETIYDKVINSYNALEKCEGVNTDFYNCIKKLSSMINVDEKMALLVLYSFDYLYLTHICVCEFLETGKISTSNIQNLENNINYNC